jgi:hypothetical protein
MGLLVYDLTLALEERDIVPTMAPAEEKDVDFPEGLITFEGVQDILLDCCNFLWSQAQCLANRDTNLVIASLIGVSLEGLPAELDAHTGKRPTRIVIGNKAVYNDHVIGNRGWLLL